MPESLEVLVATLNVKLDQFNHTTSELRDWLHETAERTEINSREIATLIERQHGFEKSCSERHAKNGRAGTMTVKQATALFAGVAAAISAVVVGVVEAIAHLFKGTPGQ